MKILQATKIYIADSKIENAGRGVFASTDIRSGEVIETSPVLVIENNDVFNLTESILSKYYFSFDENKEVVYVALGFGSLYNHSYNPNATYKKILNQHLIEFSSIRNISKNEEITINYNKGDPKDRSKLWEDIPSFKADTGV